MILNSPYITGSLTVTGNITASGGITISGSIASSSYATNAERLDNLDSTSFVFTSSYNTDSASVSTRVTKIEGNYATTGSNVFMGAQTVCANITSTGTIIAQTLNVQQVTSSIVYSSGSNIFGNLSTDVQQFTGSVRITGSLSTTGTICSTGNTCFGGSSVVTGCLGVGIASTTSAGGNTIMLYDASTPRIRLANTTTGTTSTDGGELSLFACDFNIENREASGAMNLYVNGALRQKIFNTGIACFACQVCAPQGIFINGAASLQAQFGQNSDATGTQTSAIDIISRNAANTAGFTFRIQNCATTCTTHLVYSDNTVMAFRCNGNVGIGTTTPATALHVSGSGDTTLTISISGANNPRIKFCGGPGVINRGATGDNMFFGEDADTGNYLFRGSNFVGIGTSSPGAKLDVCQIGGDKTRACDALYLRAGGNADSFCHNQILFGYNGTTDYAHAIKTRHQSNNACENGIDFFTWKFGDAAGTKAGQYVMTIAGNGRVGIGTCAPNARLSVQNTDNNLMISVLGTNGNARLYIGTDGSSNPYLRSQNSLPLYLGVDSTNVLYVNSGGSTVVGTNVNATESAAQLFLAGSGYSGIHWLDATAYYIGQNSSLRELRLWSGAASAGVRLTNGATSWTSYSDERIKTNIENIDCVLDKIDNLRTVKYHLKDIDSNDRQKRYGLIAQDLVGKFDEVLDLSKYSDENPTKYYGIRYTELVPVLVKAIQELKCQNDIFKTCLGLT